jgi:hypothetical protein
MRRFSSDLLAFPKSAQLLVFGLRWSHMATLA